MAYTDIDKPDLYFNTVLYTGNGSTQSITGVNFKPDWNWIKHRNGTSWHTLTDSVRGITKNLFSNVTNAEVTNAARIISFDTDGLTVGNDVNNSGNTYVAWNWLASNTTASNTDGSITSTVSANTTSGFSIVSYTGTGSNANVGHSLGTTPSVVIVKRRTVATGGWIFWHNTFSGLQYMIMNETGTKGSASVIWNSTVPTSSVFSIGTSPSLNASGSTYIAYCFAEKKGFSKFGSYTGNGSTDGTFVYTGFKPAFVIIKKSSVSATGWMIFDNKRNPFNDGATLRLVANGTESDASDHILDFLSNGFKIRDSDATINDSGQTLIYMAFAENPFTTSTGIPCTAR